MRISSVQQNINPTYISKSMQGGQRIFYATNSHATNPLTADTVSFGSYCRVNVRKLYGYDVRCMYSGIPLINPENARRMKKGTILSAPLGTLIPVLQYYEKSFYPVEKGVFRWIKDLPERFKSMDFEQAIEAMRKPAYQVELQNAQKPIFEKLEESAGRLDPQTRLLYDNLMEVTDKKLNGIPMTQEFSRQEFLFLMVKALGSENNTPINEVLVSILYNTPRTGELGAQEKLLEAIQKIEKMAAQRKDIEALKPLFTDAYERIQGIAHIVPFYKTSFLYDLNRILRNYNDRSLRDEMIEIALRLPSSDELAHNWMYRHSGMSAHTIAYKLLSPSVGTLEHIRPRSRMGGTKYLNLGLVSQKWNNKRGNTELNHFILKYPEVKMHIQDHIKQLIGFSIDGTIEKVGMPRDYVIGFAKTIEEQSRGLMSITGLGGQS